MKLRKKTKKLYIPLYRPHQHKTDYRDEDWELVKVIDTIAQQKRMPYLLGKEDDPEAFIFSLAEAMHLHNLDQRRKRSEGGGF